MIKNSLKGYISHSNRDKIKPMAIIAGVIVVIGILTAYLSWTSNSDTEPDAKNPDVIWVDTTKLQNMDISSDEVNSKTEIMKIDNPAIQAQEIKYLEEEITLIKNQQEDLATKIKNLEKQFQALSATGNLTRVGASERVKNKKSISRASGEKNTAAKTSKQKNKISYTIKKGDTLWGIADKYGVTVAALKEWNNLQDARIDIGDKITIVKP